MASIERDRVNLKKKQKKKERRSFSHSEFLSRYLLTLVNSISARESKFHKYTRYQSSLRLGPPPIKSKKCRKRHEITPPLYGCQINFLSASEGFLRGRRCARRKCIVTRVSRREIMSGSNPTEITGVKSRAANELRLRRARVFPHLSPVRTSLFSTLISYFSSARRLI